MDYDRFLSIVCRWAHVDTDVAERAARATLQTLAERLSPGVARAIAARPDPLLDLAAHARDAGAAAVASEAGTVGVTGTGPLSRQRAHVAEVRPVDLRQHVAGVRRVAIGPPDLRPLDSAVGAGRVQHRHGVGAACTGWWPMCVTWRAWLFCRDCGVS